MESINEALTLLRSLIDCQTAAAEALVQVKHEMESGKTPALTRDKLLAIERAQVIVHAGIRDLAGRTS